MGGIFYRPDNSKPTIQDATNHTLRKRLNDLENQLSYQKKQLQNYHEKITEYEQKVIEMCQQVDRLSIKEEKLNTIRLQSQFLINQKVEQINELRSEIDDKKRELRHEQKRAQDVQQMKIQNIQRMQSAIHQYSESIKQAMQQAKSLSDPQLFHKKKEQIFAVFLENLKTYKQKQIFQKARKCHIVLVGNISAGKSSLLNKLFNLKLRTGIGETTLEVSKVFESQHTVIFDSPGANVGFTFYDITNIELLFSVDRVFILYTTSLKDVNVIIRIMGVIKPKRTYLIRTKCDIFENEKNEKSLQQQLKADRQYLRLLSIELPILVTSAVRDISFYDNQKVRNLLNEKQQF